MPGVIRLAGLDARACVRVTDYIERIRDFLGPEEGRVFSVRAREFGLAEDGPELLQMIVLAKAAERAEAAATAAADAANLVKSEIAGFRTDLATVRPDLAIAIGSEIEDRMTQCFDDLEREVAGKARALAHAEFTAAATVRTRAIQEEVAELRRVAAEGGHGAPPAAASGEEGFVFTWRELAGLVGIVAVVASVVSWAAVHLPVLAHR